MLGDFRKAHHHHTKHLELDSPAVFDLSGTEGTRDEQQVKALCRQEDVRGSAASYVLDKIRQTPELGGGAEPGAGLQVKPADLAAVVQVNSFPFFLITRTKQTFCAHTTSLSVFLYSCLPARLPAWCFPPGARS